ncbi:MAG: hypothetical protein ACPG4N_11245 [Gammaproteobacteria bacterium]
MFESGPEEHKREIWPSFELPPINLWNAPATEPGVVDNPLYELGGVPVWSERPIQTTPPQSSNSEPKSPSMEP